MRKKTLSVLVVFALSIQGVFALTVQQIADNAILRTRRENNYGRYTIDLPSGYTSTIQFLNYELEGYEGDFKLAVNSAYLQTTNTGNTGFIQYLDNLNANWQNSYYSGSLSSKERAKSKLLSNIYRNFLIVRNDPNSSAPDINTNYNYPNNNTTTSNGTTRTYNSLGNYTATNGKTYTIWQSNDGYYRYRQGSGKYFTSETAVKTYVEVQNRLIYTAPNGRRYGIFKISNRYYFNRDNGSISVLSWVSINDTKAYINQHNLPYY